MTELIDRLIELESDVRYQEFPSEGQSEFTATDGHIPILISAPHGAVHTRNDGLKQEDEFTAGFARLVAEITGAHVLYARRKSATDPNVSSTAPYKGLLAKIVEDKEIAFVLDIHGINENRPYGIAIGTMNGISCPEQIDTIIQVLTRYEFGTQNDAGLTCVKLDGRFAAVGEDGREPITRFVWEKLHVPAAQFELNAWLRIPSRRNDATKTEPFVGDPARIELAVAAFADIVRTIANLKG